MRWLAMAWVAVSCGGSHATPASPEPSSTTVHTDAPPGQPPGPDALRASPGAAAPAPVLPTFPILELTARDPNAVKSFYATIAGWQLDAEGDHLVAKANGATVAIIGKLPPKSPVKASWLVRLAVPDVAAATAALGKLGGAVESPAADVPGVGKVAVVTDPEHARVALAGAAAAAADPQPGRFVWAELWAADPAAATRFYQAVLGWTTRDIGAGIMRYAVFEDGGKKRAGLVPVPIEKTAPQWVPFIAVPNVDEATVTAKKIRGRVRLPPVAVHGVGRVAVLLDPAGALVGVITPER